MRWLALMLPLASLLVGCATAREAPVAPPAPAAAQVAAPTAMEGSPESVAEAGLRARLASLPACAPGATVGQVSFLGMCTKMFCRDEACCNRCRWEPRYETKGGVEAGVGARVREVLQLPESAMDCEGAAWERVLKGVSVGLEGEGCVVRPD